MRTPARPAFGSKHTDIEVQHHPVGQDGRRFLSTPVPSFCPLRQQQEPVGINGFPPQASVTDLTQSALLAPRIPTTREESHRLCQRFLFRSPPGISSLVLLGKPKNRQNKYRILLVCSFVKLLSKSIRAKQRQKQNVLGGGKD